MQKSRADQKYQKEISQLIPVNCLSPAKQEMLIHQSEIVMIPSGSSLFGQDEKSEKLFFLISGDVDLFSNTQFVQTISVGDEVARSAINQNLKYSAIAKSRIVVLIVDQLLLERLILLNSKAGLDEADWLDQLLVSEVFAQFPSANIHKVFNQLDDMIVKKGDQVITQNMPGNYFYIVREGRCVVSQRNFETGETITLVELETGACFGEEVLLSNQKRSATVTMLTAGKMLRLARKDYEELIKLPSLEKLDFDQAFSRVSQGATWLDVRSHDEYSQPYLKQSQNFPFDAIEQELDKLSKEESYVLYCDAGFRSSYVASILSDKGFKISYLEGGIRQYSGGDGMSETWLDSLSDRLRDKDIAPVNLPEKENDPVEVSGSVGEQILAVDQRIRDLKSMFSTENLLAQEWLENDPSSEDLGILIEARKKIDHIESLPSTSTHDKVKDEGDSELCLLRKQLENAQSHIQEERNRVTTSDKEPDQKELTLKHVSDELEIIKDRLKDQESFELTRRESFEQQLATERKKMRVQLARFSMGLERQQTKSLEIEQIRRTAALEVQQVIEKFKEAHKQHTFRQQKMIQAVRIQLKKQAAHVIEKARQAQEEKKQALVSLHSVQKQLEELRKQRSLLLDDGGISSEVPLLVDVESMGNEINKATDQFYEADSALSLAKSTNYKARKKLDQLKQNENSVRLDFVEWFTSSEQFNLDRDHLTDEQKASLERVKKIAHEALEEAFSGKHHRPDNSRGQFFKNYK